MAPAMIVGAVVGGPIGLAAIGGVAAVAAAEYLGTRTRGTGEAELESVGRPSEIVLQAVERLDSDDAANDRGDIWRDLPGQRGQ
jgi:hypothetical protein